MINQKEKQDRIDRKEKVRRRMRVEVNPEKLTNLTNVKSILITFAVLSGLILLLVIVLLIFRARVIKHRREEATKRANML